jgi:peptidoglycan/LPS O-acetylase OafA/YrhL
MQDGPLTPRPELRYPELDSLRGLAALLSIPYLRGKGQPYPVYLVRRILRIYAPYLFALALAVARAAIWHGSLGFGPRSYRPDL